MASEEHHGSGISTERDVKTILELPAAAGTIQFQLTPSAAQKKPFFKGGSITKLAKITACIDGSKMLSLMTFHGTVKQLTRMIVVTSLSPYRKSGNAGRGIRCGHSARER